MPGVLPVEGEELTGQQNAAARSFMGISSTQGDGVPVSMGKPVLGELTYTKVRDIRTDPTVKLVRRFVVAPALEAGWSIEAEDGVPQDVIDFVHEVMDPHHDHLMRRGILGMIDYGWQPFEIVVHTRESDGAWVIKKFKDLLQDLTDILIDERTGSYAGLKNRDVVLEPEQTLLFNQEVEGTQWYGEADMVSVWKAMKPYENVRDQNDKYDRKIAGSHWVVKWPEGVSDYNGQADIPNDQVAADLLRRLETNSKISMPQPKGLLPGEQGWDISVLSDSGNGGLWLLERQRYLDVLKVRAFGSPERAILEGEFGTKAEAETHGDLAATNINLRRKDIVRILNWHVVNRILEWNYGPQYENMVRIVPNPLSDTAVTFLQGLYTSLVNAPGGVEESDRIDLEALRDRLRVPSRPLARPPRSTNLLAKLASGLGDDGADQGG